MRKVELLPTRDCEAGYGPDNNNKTKNKTKQKQNMGAQGRNIFI